MSRILIAWELGANLGHLTRLLPIAEVLQQQGHDVLFVVREIEAAAVLLEPRGFAFLQGVQPQFKAGATEGTPKRFIFCQNCVHR